MKIEYGFGKIVVDEHKKNEELLNLFNQFKEDLEEFDRKYGESASTLVAAFPVKLKTFLERNHRGYFSPKSLELSQEHFPYFNSYIAMAVGCYFEFLEGFHFEVRQDRVRHFYQFLSYLINHEHSQPEAAKKSGANYFSSETIRDRVRLALVQRQAQEPFRLGLIDRDFIRYLRELKSDELLKVA